MDRILEQKKGLRRKHLPYIGGGVLGLVFVGWVVFGNHESALRVDRDKIRIEEVTREIFHDYIRVIGNVEPLTFSQLTVQEAGNVQEILAEEGEMVKTGDVVVRLESKSLETEILNGKDRYAEEKNSVQNSLLDLEREQLNLQQERLTQELDVERKKRKYLQNKQLFEEDLIAKEEYLTAKEDYEFTVKSQQLVVEKQAKDSIRRHRQMEMLHQKLENAHRNLQLTLERLERLRVRAPIDGQLSELNVAIGQNIGSGNQIGKINVLNDYKVMARMDEHYIDRVRKGQTARLERQGKDFMMETVKVYPDVKDGQFKTDFVFVGETPPNIRTGQTYHLNLQLGADDESVTVPRGSFYQNTGGRWIFVLTADGKEAYRRTIRIGKQNPRHYQILEGLEPGERVITSGYEMFGDNERLIFK